MVPLYSQVSCSTMPNSIAQVVAGKLAHVVAVQQDGALAHVVKTHQQLDHGGFARAGGAYDGHFLARAE